jgi:hypothetical protein
MTSNPFDQMLMEMKAKREQLDTDIAALEEMRARWVGGSPLTSAPPANSGNPSTIPHDAFFGMTIAEATIKLLGMRRKRLSTNEIIDDLESGGLQRSAYNTVYSILTRREKDEQDIEKVGKQWGLPEWSGRRKRKSPSAPQETESDIPATDVEVVELAGDITTNNGE